MLCALVRLARFAYTSFSVSKTPPTPPTAFSPRSGVHRSRESWSPVERWLAVQSAVLIVVSSWACGGRTESAPGLIFFIAALGWLALLPRFREGRPLHYGVFVPLALWLILLAIGLLNPSHLPGQHGWTPRPGWIAWLPATVDREATLIAQLPWIAALLQGTLLVALRPDERVVRFIWTVAAVNGFVLATTGAMFRLAQSPLMLGFIETPEPTYFFATFFYKNHWAAYGALGAVAGGALALRSWRRSLAGNPRARGRFLFFSVTSLLTAITLPLPGSRAGALFAVFLVLSFLVALFWQLWREHRFSPRQRLTAGVFVAVLVLGCSGYGVNVYAPKAREDWERTTREFSQLKSDVPLGLRTQVSRDTARMAKVRPWFGWGVGSFEIVFPIFQGNYLRDKNGRSEARFEFAHNDWLQLAAEAGLAGLLVVVIPVGVETRRIWRKSGLAGRWGAAGCGVIAVYAWIDFPFNNPAVLVLWNVLLFTAAEAGPARGTGFKHTQRPMHLGFIPM